MLAQTEDDTIFLIALGVVLLFAVYQLVFSPDGVRVAENKESQAEETDFERRLFQKLDHTNDLLVSTRNSLLILIILVVILASLYLIFR
tara:strand:- start:4762 stop:5028 length:267 start_codon:yes stop_codon:yes gene_type:complete